MDEPESFAAALQDIRSAIGISQHRLAVKAGVDHSYISRLEASHRAPTVEMIQRLAIALGGGAEIYERLMTTAGFLVPSYGALLHERECRKVLSLLTNPAIDGQWKAVVRALLYTVSLHPCPQNKR